MSFFGDVFGGEAAKDAAAANQRRLDQLKTEGFGYLDTGRTGALNSLGSAEKAFDPVTGLATKYNAAGDMYLNALGLNGAEGNTAATAAFQSSPGYDFKVNQSLDALDRRAASRGLLGSGNNTLDTLNVVHGLADQDYGAYLDRLSGLATLGANETNTAATGIATARAARAPVWMNDANARVGLASGVTRGLNDQETQAANAEMAAGGNLLNFGMNLAKLGTSFIPGLGGTSLLGGGMSAVGGRGGI